MGIDENGEKAYREAQNLVTNQLSYSSMSTLLGCQFKYWQYKVVKATPDPDSNQDKLSFRFGKAFHKLQELWNHSFSKFNESMFKKVCSEFSLEVADTYQLYACCVDYAGLHNQSKMVVLGCEIHIITKTFNGYVDAVMQDIDGGWWIVDLKTSGQVQENIFPRLHCDPQLNLYGGHAQIVAEKLKLDIKKFAGVRYRVVQKPKSVVKPGESMIQYQVRICDTLKSYDVGIQKENMIAVAEILEQFEFVQKVASSMSKTTAPLKNRGNCMAYMTPCEYWSKCHGKTYTECQAQNVASLKADMIPTRSPGLQNSVPENVEDDLF